MSAEPDEQTKAVDELRAEIVRAIRDIMRGASRIDSILDERGARFRARIPPDVLAQYERVLIGIHTDVASALGPTLLRLERIDGGM